MNSVINKANIRKLDLNLLLIFEALLQEHSVTKAAARLGLSQAAVSASLKRLRSAYGDQLFLRGQRGLRPTSQAVLLQPLIEDALALIRRSIDQPDRSTEPSSMVQVVAIGISDDFEIAYGARLIHAMHAALPRIRLVFRQTNSAVVATALLERVIDIALTSGGAKDTRIKNRSLGSSGYLCLYDPSVRGSVEPMTLSEYVARDHILVSYSGLTGLVDEILSEHGMRRTIRASTSHFSALPFLLTGTDAIATLPSHAAMAIAKAGNLAISRCPVTFPSYAIDVSWRFDAIRQKHVLSVRDQIIEMFRPRSMREGEIS